MYNENGLIYSEFEDNFRRVVPLMLLYHFTASYKDVELISDKLKQHYFPEGTSIEENPKKTVDVSCTRNSITIYFYNKLYVDNFKLFISKSKCILLFISDDHWWYILKRGY